MLCQLLARTSRTAGGRVVGVGVTPCSCTRAASFSSLPSSSGSSSSSSSSIRTSPRKGNIPSTNIVLSPSLLRHFARISVSSPSSSFSTNAREATPPPPPPPPPPSSSFSSSSVLPSNLYLADASVLTRYKPVPLETLIQRKEQMEGIIDPAALTLPVRRALGAGVGGEEEEEQMSLDARVFGVPVRKDIIHRVVTWQRAKKRLGLASTKRVGDIRGSTKKRRPQKGSGRARAGKKHAAQFRGGMKAHGPVQRDFSFKLNKKVRALGVRMALSAKAREGKIVVVDALSLPEPKTRLLEAALREEGLEEEAEEGEMRRMKKVLLIDGEALERNMALAVRNLPYARGLPQLGANVIDIVAHDTLIAVPVLVIYTHVTREDFTSVQDKHFALLTFGVTRRGRGSYPDIE
ncbi:50s ribosomal protein l4 [Nannochloropsis oceanica]